MFSPKSIPPRDKTPFLVRSLETHEGLEPRMLLDGRPDEVEPSEVPKDVPKEVQASTDLLIKGLLDRLPKPNGAWPLEERARWLQTAASIFGLIYETNDQREITVAVAKDAHLTVDR